MSAYVSICQLTQLLVESSTDRFKVKEKPLRAAMKLLRR